ncbi:MAG: hypothetical protein AB9834_19245 [Lentimicrobium sp.]
MKKRVVFQASEDIIIFKDSKSDLKFYGMSKDVLEEKSAITEKFGRVEANVPDEYMIKVIPFILSESKDSNTDIYIPLLNTGLIDFPINRIEWMWIQLK